jgi:hypothetical protein
VDPDAPRNAFGLQPESPKQIWDLPACTPSGKYQKSGVPVGRGLGLSCEGVVSISVYFLVAPPTKTKPLIFGFWGNVGLDLHGSLGEFQIPGSPDEDLPSVWTCSCLPSRFKTFVIVLGTVWALLQSSWGLVPCPQSIKGRTDATTCQRLRAALPSRRKEANHDRQISLPRSGALPPVHLKGGQTLRPSRGSQRLYRPGEKAPGSQRANKPSCSEGMMGKSYIDPLPGGAGPNPCVRALVAKRHHRKDGSRLLGRSRQHIQQCSGTQPEAGGPAEHHCGTAGDKHDFAS